MAFAARSRWRGVRGDGCQRVALEGIGTSHLHDGNPGQAVPYLQQALAIYQRIGAPAARRVQQTIQDHQLTSAISQPQPAAPNTQRGN